MVLGWAMLVPIGVMVARFFKIVPGQPWPQELDNRLWWNMHRLCQYGACAVVCAGLVFILAAPPVVASGGPHKTLGWIVLCLLALQVGSGLLRGTKGGPTQPAPDGSLNGDHFDMSPRRIAFEYVHKLVGYAAVVLSMITILSGLWQVNGANWMWVAICVWWGLLGLAFWALQNRGMAHDTYQAIWGPDPDLPGNRRPPIGFGITRDTGLPRGSPDKTG
jgi:hypothetical protein